MNAVPEIQRVFEGPGDWVIFQMDKRLKIVTVFMALALLTSACVSPVTHRPLSPEEFARTDFASLIPYRWWGDESPPRLEASLKQLAPALKQRYPEAVDANPANAPMLSSLVLSGGGSNGAFGAGILAGWSESGSRPQFDYVTGVSTGAVIAPFAFLGPEYDETLLEIYASLKPDGIYRWSLFGGLLFGSAVSDTTPMRERVKAYITPDIVAAIAEQQRLGRILAIITTHLDANRPVLWDLTAIAQQPMDQALPLIRQVILASAAIPAFFPPVPIEWEDDGKRFTELHVDGSVTRQAFAYPAQLRVDKLNEVLGLTFRRQIFVIQNGNTASVYKPAPVKVLPIAQRALDVLLLDKLNGDIERIYNLARRDGVGFNMVAIPNEFLADGSTEFDPDYIGSLIDLGRAIGRTGDFWQDLPPSERAVGS